MLVLARKIDESIIINDNIEITVLEIQGDKVKIGIMAPKNVPVFRKEVLVEIKSENLKAVSVPNINLSEIKQKIVDTNSK